MKLIGLPELPVLRWQWLKWYESLRMWCQKNRKKHTHSLTTLINIAPLICIDTNSDCILLQLDDARRRFLCLTLFGLSVAGLFVLNFGEFGINSHDKLVYAFERQVMRLTSYVYQMEIFSFRLVMIFLEKLESISLIRNSH